MRYAFVSDIHANLPAWEAVIQDIAESDVNEIVCLGDIVGYGPSPSEVLASVRQYTDKIVMGNHDAAVCGALDASIFHGEAEQIIHWSAQQLSDEDLDFFNQCPLSLAADEFRVTHADFMEPGAFDYLEEEDHCMEVWERCTEPLLLIGHTHLPAVHRLTADGRYEPMQPKDFIVDKACRYIINVGSVGMSRDENYRASYVIFDDELRTVSWRRVDYDVGIFKQTADRRLGPTEQIAYLYKEYEQRAAPVKQSFDSHAFLTTQDLTGIIHQFEPDSSHATLITDSGRVKKIKAARRTTIIRRKTTPPQKAWERSPPPSDTKAKIIIASSIAGAILLLFGVMMILRGCGRRQQRQPGTYAPTPVTPVSASASTHELQFGAGKQAYAIWRQAGFPIWPNRWTAEIWYRPLGTDLCVLMMQGNDPANFALIYAHDRRQIVVRQRGVAEKFDIQLELNQPHHIVIGNQGITRGSTVHLYVDGKRFNPVSLPTEGRLKEDRDIVFMPGDGGAMASCAIYQGLLPPDFVATRWNEGKGGNSSLSGLPRSNIPLARFLLTEGRGGTVKDSAPDARPNSRLELIGDVTWNKSGIPR